MDIILKNNKLTSLSLLSQINIFREGEGKSPLAHNDLLKIIRKEFEEEIYEGNISLGSYKDKKGEYRPLYELTESQTRQLFIRCKAEPSEKFVIDFGLRNVDFRVVSRVRFETTFGNLLLEALNELSLKVISQFKVDKYRIDFYIPKLNLAIEYDEKHHSKGANKILDRHRQKFIEEKLGCVFIRCNYNDTDIQNVMKVVKKIFLDGQRREESG